MSCFWVDLSPAFNITMITRPRRTKYSLYPGPKWTLISETSPALPITKTAGFSLAKPCGNAKLSPLVFEFVQPCDELFRLEHCVHA